MRNSREKSNASYRRSVRDRIYLPDGYAHERGFVRQTEPHDFVYDENYKARQSTNEAMSYMRLGWLAAHIPYDDWAEMSMVDIGCGSGEFVKHASDKFKRVRGYDVCGTSISRDELMDTEWDIAVMSDVVEHFNDIEELFDIQWNHAFISFPETPAFETFEEMREWRHFKPNEHLWYLNIEGFLHWIEKEHREATVVSSSNFEDSIRTRWNRQMTNISTVLLKRK